MPHEPVRTTVVGSYPFPGWLELAAAHLDELGPVDREEATRDAVWAAIGDQVRAGLDVITDGEQTRFDFNLSFYAYLEGLELERSRAGAGGLRRTTSAVGTASSASSPRRAGSAFWTNGGACRSSPRQAQR